MPTFGRTAVALAVVGGLNLLFVAMSLALGSLALLIVAVLFAISSGTFVLRLLAL